MLDGLLAFVCVCVCVCECVCMHTEMNKTLCLFQLKRVCCAIPVVAMTTESYSLLNVWGQRKNEAKP